MSLPVYATEDDYTAYIGGTAPANIEALLRSVSNLVHDAIAGAYYLTDPDTGVASDTDVVEALRDATCVQAAAWVTLKIDPLAGGVVTTAGTVASKSLDGGSVSYAGAQLAAQARATAVDQLVPEAVRILRAQNLLATRVWSYG